MARRNVGRAKRYGLGAAVLAEDGSWDDQLLAVLGVGWSEIEVEVGIVIKVEAQDAGEHSVHNLEEWMA